MDKEKIKEAVKVYLNEENSDYAIMLNGKWGCGKTYFVKNELIKYIQEQNDREVIYISLFGITTIDELYNNISLHLVNIKANEYAQNKRKLYDSNTHERKINTSESNSISFWAGMLNKSFNLLPQSETLKKITSDINGKVINFNKYVFIFDDLERNSLGYAILLGFFDKVADQNNLKAILVCNEENIKKADKEDFYKTFKEKVVGLTIEYSTDMQYEFNNIIEKHIKDIDIQKYFENHKKSILALFKLADSCNLRTLIFACKRFAEVYEDINEMYFKCDATEKYTDEFFKEIVLAVVGSSIIIKEKKGQNEFNNNVKINVRMGDKNISTADIVFGNIYGYNAYKFLDDYIDTYNLDYEMIEKFIPEFITNEDIKSQNDIKKELQSLYNIDDDREVIDKLNNIADRIKTNQININIYPQFLNDLFILGKRIWDIEELNRLKAVIFSNAKKRVDEFSSLSWSTFAYGDSEASSFKKELYDFLKEEKLKNNDSKLIEIFADKDNDKFVKEFQKYMMDKQSHMERNGKLMSIIGTEKVFESVKNLNAQQISDFWTGLSYVYQRDVINLNEFYHADKEFFIELKEKIKNELLTDKEKSITQKLHLEWFCNYLNEISEKL